MKIDRPNPQCAFSPRDTYEYLCKMVEALNFELNDIKKNALLPVSVEKITEFSERCAASVALFKATEITLDAPADKYKGRIGALFKTDNSNMTVTIVANDGEIAVRNCTSGAWSSWKRVTTS